MENNFPICSSLLEQEAVENSVRLMIENSFPDCSAVLRTGRNARTGWTEDREQFFCLFCSSWNRKQMRTELD
jgi:hypothetical protein